MADSIIVRSKIKTVVEDLNVSGDFGDALNDKVVALIKEAAGRTKANGRKTLKPCDL